MNSQRSLLYSQLLKFFQQKDAILLRPKKFLYHTKTLQANNKNELSVGEKFPSHANLLFNYGFQRGQIVRILTASEDISNVSIKDLTSNLSFWVTFPMKEKILTTLTSQPELLTMNPDYVGSHINELMKIFTRKDIHKLILTCPKILTDDISVITEKVQYIVHSMGFEQKSIVKSKALQFDLHHIKSRHIFMLRSGCYLTGKSAAIKNPPLSKIFSRNIQTLLDVTKLSKEEYDAFCEAYNHEYLEENDENSDEED